MLRTFLVIFLAVALGKLIYLFNETLGYICLILVFILAEFVPRFIASLRRKIFYQKICEWINENGFKDTDLVYRAFFRGKVKWITSDVQLVFSLDNNKSQYFFVCGGWLFGLMVNKIGIYKVSDGNLQKEAALNFTK